MNNHFILLMATFKKLKISNSIKDMEKWEPRALLVDVK